MHSPAVAEKSRFHSVTEGVGGFHRDTTAVMAVPSIVTTMLKGVDIWSATLGGGGGVKETTYTHRSISGTSLISSSLHAVALSNRVLK